jgi:hypothetical protein
VCVDIDPAFDPALPTSAAPSGLRLALSREPNSLSTLLPTTSPRFTSLPVGARVEIAQESFQIMRKVGEVIGSKDGIGGAGLIIDYGAARSFDNSFRVSPHATCVQVELMLGLPESRDRGRVRRAGISRSDRKRRLCLPHRVLVRYR